MPFLVTSLILYIPKTSMASQGVPPRCAHTKRDGRCGFCGPRLTAKAEELSAAGKVPLLTQCEMRGVPKGSMVV
jgi:hypothetical protein